MGSSETVVIRNRSGRKICTIDAPQGRGPLFTLPVLPFLGIRYRNVWKEPESIIKWAWLQSFLIVQSIKEPSLISRQTRCHCTMCGQDSIAPKCGGLFNRESVVGFRCVNKNCQMFEVTIPIVLTTQLLEMPQELFAKILQPLPNERGSEKLSMFIWPAGKRGKKS